MMSRQYYGTRRGCVCVGGGGGGDGGGGGRRGYMYFLTVY